MNHSPILLIGSLLLSNFLASAQETADRTAVERIYQSHRLAATQTFEEAMPPAKILELVNLDQKKEALLKGHYGVEVTPAMIEAELRRIVSTTRAPEVLAEIKHALGDDAQRFANAVARPLIVERELRSHFDNDAKIHAAQHHAADLARTDLISGKILADMDVVTWQLMPRLTDNHLSPPVMQPVPTHGTAKSHAYSNESTAQIAQPVETPATGAEKQYFENLDPELQQVLRVQLRKPGDVSAVIETPNNFLVFKVNDISAELLTGASKAFPKRNYQTWIAEPNPP